MSVPLLQTKSFAHRYRVSMRLRLNELPKSPVSLALVLDDCHDITDESIHEAVAFLLDNLPATLNFE